MTNSYKIGFIFLMAIILCVSFGTAVFASVLPQIQTTAATNIQSTSATLNANVTDLGLNYTANVYFEWGTSPAYGNQTPSVTQSFSGFSLQTVYGLIPYTNYHYRAVISNAYGMAYGQDMTFFTGKDNTNMPTVVVQTVSATYVGNFQATLNGSLANVDPILTDYVYFQFGKTTSYGTDTPQQPVGYSSAFMQNIADLNSGSTYHFRAVAHGRYGTVYGPDMTFSTTGSINGFNYGNSSLSVNKQVINLTSGNLSWSSTTNANPSDVLNFSITLKADGQDVHNVIVKDIFPSNLIYKGTLTVNNSNHTGDITLGVNIGTIPAGQTSVIAYQAQVVGTENFGLGATTITNNATIPSTEGGSQNASATVFVNKAVVYGATTVSSASSVSTGLTNNFLTDSFLIPLLLIILGMWFYFSGSAVYFADWVRGKV